MMPYPTESVRYLEHEVPNLRNPNYRVIGRRKPLPKRMRPLSATLVALTGRGNATPAIEGAEDPTSGRGRSALSATEPWSEAELMVVMETLLFVIDAEALTVVVSACNKKLTQP